MANLLDSNLRASLESVRIGNQTIAKQIAACIEVAGEDGPFTNEEWEQLKEVAEVLNG